MTISAPLPYTLRQLQYALAVADTLSFTRAAERCHVSQPSLSAQVAELESALGVQLFERSRRRVLITPAGQRLLERARVILREAEDLMHLARRSADPLEGTLRLGVIPTISPYLLPQITEALGSAHPNLVAQWAEDKTDVLVEQLQRGELDTALLALEADLGDVQHEVIGFDPFVLATAPDHPLGRLATPATPSELQHQNVLLLDEGHCLRAQALTWCTQANAQELAFRATSLSTLVQMVAGGSGVTLLPQMSVPVEAARAKLRLRAFAPPVPGRTIALIWRPGSPLEPGLRRLAATIRRAYPGTATAMP